jgi:hypothetical protein
MLKPIANKSLCMGLLLLIVAACNKPQPKPEDAPTASPRSVVPPEQHFLHKTFSVQKYESFELDIPAHCLRPRLHGDFTAFRYGDQGNRASDAAASVDVLLFDQQQFDDFQNGPGDATIRATQNMYEQKIDWALPSSFDAPRRYYLVFNNATGKPKTKIVEADFTLSFD